VCHVALVERERRRKRRQLRCRGAAEVDETGALRGHRVVRQRLGGTDEHAFHRLGVEIRPRLREQGCVACNDRGGGARAVDGSEERGTGAAARFRGTETHTGCDDVRLHPTVERESGRREVRHAIVRAVDDVVGGPDRNCHRDACA
jgi:hypothetical protein